MADLVRRTGRTPTKRSRLQDRGPLTEYLAFRLADDVYATPVELVREILKPPPLTPVPRAPFTVLGIISVRGQLVTVYDLRRKLRVEEQAPSRRARVLLVESPQGETLGLYVDEVLQVYRLAEVEIEPAVSALGGEVASYISGIARPTVASRPDATRGKGHESKRDAPAPKRDEGGEGAPVATQPIIVVLLDLRALLAE